MVKLLERYSVHYCVKKGFQKWWKAAAVEFDQ